MNSSKIRITRIDYESQKYCVVLLSFWYRFFAQQKLFISIIYLCILFDLNSRWEICCHIQKNSKTSAEKFSPNSHSWFLKELTSMNTAYTHTHSQCSFVIVTCMVKMRPKTTHVSRGSLNKFHYIAFPKNFYHANICCSSLYSV